jgi:hypothetical protein
MQWKSNAKPVQTIRKFTSSWGHQNFMSCQYLRTHRAQESALRNRRKWDAQGERLMPLRDRDVGLRQERGARYSCTGLL